MSDNYIPDSADVRKGLASNLQQYRSGFSFTKELLQNADDAPAGSLFCGVSETMVEDGNLHPLFQNKGLFILNDGKFDLKDQKSIKGHKSRKKDQEDSIGRFGLGLKSVFHFCDAFFFLSSSHRKDSDLGEMGFVNPWDKLPMSDESELFHKDWAEFDRSKVAESLREFVNKITEIQKWFLIWVPLRHRNYESDPKCVISNKFYSDDFESDEVLVKKIFGKELERKLPAGISFLENLSHFELYGTESANPMVKIERDSDNWISKKKEGCRSLNGNLSVETLSDEESMRFSLTGFQNLIKKPNLPNSLASIKKHEDWPSHDGNPHKAKAHAGFLFLRPETDSDDYESLSVRRCCFLPLSKDSETFGNNDDGNALQLLLHGYYFCDDGRKRADDDSDEVSGRWNHALARELIAPKLLPEFSELLNDSNISKKSAGKLAKFLAEAAERFFEVKFGIERHALVLRVRPQGTTVFEAIARTDSDSFLPLNVRAKSLSNVLEIAPGLSTLLKDESNTVYFEREAWIFSENEAVEHWVEENIEVLLDDRFTISLDEEENFNTTIDLLKGIESSENEAALGIAVRKAIARTYEKESKPKDISCSKIREVLKFCEEEHLVHVDFNKFSGKSGRSLFHALAESPESFVCLPFEYGDENSLESSQFALAAVDSWASNNEEDRNKASDVARSIISSIESSEGSSLLAIYKFLPVAEWKQGGEKEVFVTLTELREFSESGRLFNRSPITKLLGQALPEENIYLFSESLVEDLEEDLEFTEISDFIENNRPVLSAGENRVNLVDRAISEMHNDSRYKELVRFFLHGNAEEFEDREPPLFAPDSGTWVKIAKAFFKERAEQWRVLPEELLGNLTDAQRETFGIKRMNVESIAELIRGDLEVVRSLRLEDLERNEVRDVYVAEHVLEEELLKALPVHRTTENTSKSILENTFIEEGSWPLPPDLLREFSFLITPPDDQVKQILKRIAPPLSSEEVLDKLLNSGSPTRYTGEIFKIIKPRQFSPSLEQDSEIKSIAWTTKSSGEATSLSRVLHPEYSSVANKILEETKSESGYCLLNSVKAPQSEKDEDFRRGIKRYCLDRSNTLNVLGSLCRRGSMVLGISEEVYGNLEDSEKKSFFESILEKKALRKILSKNLPLVAFLQEFFPEEIEVSMIEDFLFPNGREGENLLGVPQTEKTKSLLRDLASECEKQKNPGPLLDVYLLYLKSAVGELRDCFTDEILPKLKLLSKDEVWRETSKLCLDCDSIDEEFQLDPRIESVVEEICPAHERYGKPKSIPEEDVLEDYFRLWLQKVPPPVIGGFLSFLGDETPAACGLASQYLENHGTPNDVRKELLAVGVEEVEKRFGDKRMKLSIANPEALEVTALSGERIAVTQRKTTTPNEIGFLRLFTNDARETVHELQLNKFSTEDLDYEVLEKALRNTWVEILKEAYGYCSFGGEEKLEALIKKLSEISRIEIHVAQQIALRKAFQFLESKNLPEKSLLGTMAREYDECLRKKCHELKSLDEEIRNNAGRVFEETENMLLSNLHEILESDLEEGCEEEQFLLNEIRKSVQDECQYSESSIPFEIFQNADDALLQLDRPELANSEFRVEVKNNELKFLHWGRPINSWRDTGLDRESAKQRKYDQDLDKMLFLHGSAKRMKENDKTTGKFGVGFKSVYLLCDRPKIVSDKIDFEIVAGFYPKQLEDDTKQTLRDSFAESEKGGTALLLQCDSSEKISDALAEFKRTARFLPLFAKAVTKIRVEDDQPSEIRLETSEVGEGAHFRVIHVLKNDNPVQKVAIFNLGKHGRLVLKEEESLFAPFDGNLPTFWVTVPTDEKLRLGFLMNGPFKLDIGRAKIHRDVKSNLKTVQEMKHDFWRGLEDMWDYYEKTGEVESYERWESLWKLFGSKFRSRYKDNPEEVGTKLLRELLWGEEGGKPQGYHRFLRNRRALPNGLDQAPKLLELERMEWKCSEFFESSILEKVKDWNAMEGLSETLVSGSVSTILEDLASQSFEKLKSFGLFELFKREGCFANLKVEDTDARRLGSVFNEETLKKFEDENPDETEDLKKRLKDLKFRSKSGDWHTAKLLFANHDLERENQESLVSKFAPEEYLLDQTYLNSEAFSFFDTCRGNFKCPDEEEMIGWGGKLEENAKKEGFCLFLLSNSATADSICERYREADETLRSIGWLQQLELKTFLRSAGALEEHEKSQLLAKLGITTLAPEESEWEEEVEPPQSLDAETELRELLKYFRKNKDEIISNYERIIYPDGRSPDLPNDWESTREDPQARKEWLKVFIVSLTYRFGYANPESARNFLAECERERRLEIFANRHTTPHEWMDLLDKMIDHQDENHQRYFSWISNFPVFYKISKYLDVYVRIFHAMLHQEFSDIDEVANPGNNPHLEGWGIIAPGFKRDLGMGIHFVLSEFARIRNVKIPSFHKFCYLPKKSVRDYLGALGCRGLSEQGYEPGDSERIHEFLVSKLGRHDATFDHCFHLPLFMRADNRYSKMFIVQD